jgi:hypothetical protein
MTRKKDESGIWLIETEGSGRFVIWSEPHQLSEKKAVAKFRRLTKGRFKKTLKVTGRLAFCPVDNCSSFAKQLLGSGELKWTTGLWWVIGDVEVEAGEDLNMATVCPMCEKHARRFRKTLRKRVLRIEERLDKLDLEHCLSDGT